MAQDKRGGKGFCPFCGSEFEGGRDECPNCGQDIRQYNDDLGPVLDKIQTVTNIDMKSTKVRVTMSVIIFVVVFAGVLVILENIDLHGNSDADDEPPIEGLVLDIKTNGYMDLTGDFAKGYIKVLPLYEPDLRLQFSLKPGLEDMYTKIMWVVETEKYNENNAKNPFYTKVTKEVSGSSSIYKVIWENVDVGRFIVTADCYKEDGTYDVFEGFATYYGVMDRTYSWTYNGSVNTIKYTMSSDEVRACYAYDLTERIDLQTRGSMADLVVDSQAIENLHLKLKEAYTKNYRYTYDGYADYVLSFVQQCFPFEYDSFNYRVSDYWAYPTETLLWGCGDDEDRAILYCSIMKVAMKDSGRDVALLRLPDSTVAALQLDMSSSFIKDPKMVKGTYHKFTVADTSSNLGLGEIRSIYDIADTGTSLTFSGSEYYIHDLLIVA